MGIVLLRSDTQKDWGCKIFKKERDTHRGQSEKAAAWEEIKRTETSQERENRENLRRTSQSDIFTVIVLQ